MAIQPVTMNKISSLAPASPVSEPSVKENTNDIQTQIATKQQHLKKVTSDDSITATEKEEKRRQLQKEIDDLNRDLERKKQEQEEKAKEAAKKQEQADALKAEMQKKAVSTIESKEEATRISSNESEADKVADAKAESEKTADLKEEQQKADMSVKEIQQMLSADYLIQKDIVQEQVDAERKGKIDVLKAEIKQDELYGANTEKKEAEIEVLQQKENFWSDAQKAQETQKQAQAQNNMQTTVNANAKIVIDQI